MNTQEIMHSIMNVEEFPTLPIIVTKVIEVCEDENSTVDDLAKIISNDQSITARILKLSNSAYYGYLRKVNTISKAITILGFDTIKSLSISASVFDTFKKIKSNYYFDRCQFWIHSIGVAVISKLIAHHLHNKQTETAFLNGLMHDIGKLFFETYYIAQYEEVLKEVAVHRCSIRDAELKTLGVGHDEVGGWLANRWQFPPELVSPIQFHHNLDKCPPEHLYMASITQLADYLCRSHNIGSGGDNLVPELDPLVISTLGLEQSDIEELLQKAAEEKEQIFTFMAIMD